MKFRCTIQPLPDRGWLVRHDGPEAGRVEVRGATREQAIDKMRGELRYRMELCPCTGESYRHLVIEIVAS